MYLLSGSFQEKLVNCDLGVFACQDKALRFHETEMRQSLMRTAQAMFSGDREQIAAFYSLHVSGQTVEIPGEEPKCCSRMTVVSGENKFSAQNPLGEFTC